MTRPGPNRRKLDQRQETGQLRRAARSQPVEKASQSLPPQWRINIKHFCRGVYTAENTSQLVSVEFVRRMRTNYARNKLQPHSKKCLALFRRSQTGQLRRAARSFFVLLTFYLLMKHISIVATCARVAVP